MSCKSHGTNQSDVISTKDRVIVDKNELVCIEFVTGKEEECKVRDENNKVIKLNNRGNFIRGFSKFYIYF